MHFHLPPRWACLCHFKHFFALGRTNLLARLINPAVAWPLVTGKPPDILTPSLSSCNWFHLLLMSVCSWSWAISLAHLLVGLANDKQFKVMSRNAKTSFIFVACVATGSSNWEWERLSREPTHISISVFTAAVGHIAVEHGVRPEADESGILPLLCYLLQPFHSQRQYVRIVPVRMVNPRVCKEEGIVILCHCH